eukprot:Em0044g29a
MWSQGQLRVAGDEDGVTDELEVSAREVKELQDSHVDTEEEAEPDLHSWGTMKEWPQEIEELDDVEGEENTLADEEESSQLPDDLASCFNAAIHMTRYGRTAESRKKTAFITPYRLKFIPDYAMVAAPLTELAKKAAPNKVIWSETDASDWGVGGVLSQVDERASQAHGHKRDRGSIRMEDGTGDGEEETGDGRKGLGMGKKTRDGTGVGKTGLGMRKKGLGMREMGLGMGKSVKVPYPTIQQEKWKFLLAHKKFCTCLSSSDNMNFVRRPCDVKDLLCALEGLPTLHKEHRGRGWEWLHILG